MNLIKDALWVLGDSFCAESLHPHRWAQYAKEYFEKKYPSKSITRYYNYAEGSCDTQTIMDNWIKLIPHMNEDDVLIVCLSDISRARFPNKVEIQQTTPFHPNPFNAPVINSYFMYGPAGWDPTNSDLSVSRADVPFPTLEEWRDYTRFTNFLNSTKGYDKSRIDVIESLYKITPCRKKFIYTWADYGIGSIDNTILKSENIHSKKWIDENIMGGKWESQHESWIRSNGEIGVKDDGHLSDACERMMFNYFVNEFKL